MWSGRFERAGADPSAIEAEIADSLGRELEIEVIRAESERGSREPDPDVHELIYKGYAAMFDAATSGLPALQQAEKYFTQALDRDPENPRAQTGLGGYHAVMALQLRVPDPVPYLAKADAILQQVIEQHPNTSETHQYKGLVNVTRASRKKPLDPSSGQSRSIPAARSAMAISVAHLCEWGVPPKGSSISITPCG